MDKFMPKKIKNVFFKSLTFQKFLEAHNRAKKNKMYKNEVLKFDLNLESNIISIINGIKNNTFKVGDYYSFIVYEPKERLIHSLPYRDRVVHQWYVEEFVKPYIMPKFIGTSFACLPDRGTHKAVSAVQKMMQKYSKKYPDYYILKCDIRKYFNSIDTNVLFEIMKKYIDDKALLNFTHQLIFEKRPFNTPAGIPIRKLY
jgi:RNA-directed DNA polymerase